MICHLRPWPCQCGPWQKVAVPIRFPPRRYNHLHQHTKYHYASVPMFVKTQKKIWPTPFSVKPRWYDWKAAVCTEDMKLCRHSCGMSSHSRGTFRGRGKQQAQWWVGWNVSMSCSGENRDVMDVPLTASDLLILDRKTVKTLAIQRMKKREPLWAYNVTVHLTVSFSGCFFVPPSQQMGVQNGVSECVRKQPVWVMDHVWRDLSKQWSFPAATLQRPPQGDGDPIW